MNGGYLSCWSNLLFCQRVRASVTSANDERRFRWVTMTRFPRLAESSTLRDVSGDQHCGVVMGVQGEMGREGKFMLSNEVLVETIALSGTNTAFRISWVT